MPLVRPWVHLNIKRKKGRRGGKENSEAKITATGTLRGRQKGLERWIRRALAALSGVLSSNPSTHKVVHYHLVPSAAYRNICRKNTVYVINLFLSRMGRSKTKCT